MIWGSGFFIAFLLLYLFWIEPRWLVVRQFVEPLPGLKAPLKVVVVSDIQPNRLHWPVRRLAKVFATLNRHEPDVAIWLGDFVAGPNNGQRFLKKYLPPLHKLLQTFLPGIEEVAPALAELKPRMGHVAVLGERDRALSEEVVTDALERQGIEVVGGSIAMLDDPDSDRQFQVLGYGSRLEKTRGTAFLHERLNQYVPAIGICHSPDEFSPTRGGPPVVLAGHTHGGQVRLPCLGAFVLPVDNRRFDRGWYTEWGQRFFVTSGLGTAVLPIRFLCPPEIAVIEFVPPK
jgi:uncharacterized protein